MKLAKFRRIVLGLGLGLVLVFDVMSSLVNAEYTQNDYGTDDTLLGYSETGDTFLSQGNVQQDYLNVGDYVRKPPPWWF